MPHHPRGTLTPLVPLSLRAFKGEGERRIGACICALAHMQAPNSVPGEGERKRGGDWAMSRGLVRGGGEGERRRDWGLGDIMWSSSVRGGGDGFRLEGAG